MTHADAPEYLKAQLKKPSVPKLTSDALCRPSIRSRFDRPSMGSRFDMMGSVVDEGERSRLSRKFSWQARR